MNPSIVTSSIYILDRVDYLSQLCTGVCGSTHAAVIISACHYMFDRDTSRTARSTTRCSNIRAEPSNVTCASDVPAQIKAVASQILKLGTRNLFDFESPTAKLVNYICQCGSVPQLFGRLRLYERVLADSCQSQSTCDTTSYTIDVHSPTSVSRILICSSYGSVAAWQKF